MRKLTLRPSRLYLAISLAAAALAALTLLAYLRNVSSRIAESGRLVGLVVAARDLEAGEVLDPSCLTTVDFPDLYLLPGTFTDPLEATGGTLRSPIHAGEPLLRSSLWSPQSGGLAGGRLDKGFLAYPLPASSISLPSSELCEGSRVDLLAIRGEKAWPLLENVEVLGISGRRPATVSAGTDMGSASGTAGECIMLQLTSEEACLLAAARENGKVEMALRPAGKE